MAVCVVATTLDSKAIAAEHRVQYFSESSSHDDRVIPCVKVLGNDNSQLSSTHLALNYSTGILYLTVLAVTLCEQSFSALLSSSGVVLYNASSSLYKKTAHQ